MSPSLATVTGSRPTETQVGLTCAFPHEDAWALGVRALGPSQPCAALWGVCWEWEPTQMQGKLRRRFLCMWPVPRAGHSVHATPWTRFCEPIRASAFTLATQTHPRTCDQTRKDPACFMGRKQEAALGEAPRKRLSRSTPTHSRARPRSQAGMVPCLSSLGSQTEGPLVGLAICVCLTVRPHSKPKQAWNRHSRTNASSPN